MRNLYLCWALSLCVVLTGRAAETVTISEFMASNNGILADEDGLFPDWVEIRNSGPAAVNLDGWFLTDAANNLTKWRFPATNIASGGFVIVFADGKDRRIPGAPLHANFNLSAEGEYLALVKPDGVTKATEFAPTFPQQTLNVSYGFGVLASNFTAVTTSATVRVHIPASDVLGTNWLYPGFDDSAWIEGTNGVGYGVTNAFTADYATAIAPTAPVIHYRLNETAGATAANIGSGASMNGTYNGVTQGGAGPRPPAFNGFEANNNAAGLNGTTSFVGGPAGFFSNRGAFSVGGWVNASALSGTRIGLFGQNDCVEFGFINGSTIELWTPGGGSLQVNYPHPINTWHHIMGVGDGTAIRIYIDGVQAGSGGIATANYGSSGSSFNIGGGGVQDASGNFFPGQIDEVVAYHRALSPAEVLSLYQSGTNGAGVAAANFVRTDVGPAMSNVTAAAYVRIPFVVADAANVSGMTLRMRYDDGFVAYINGTPVAQANAPAELEYDSGATNTHTPAVVETFTFGSSMLQTGTNVLAIHGLNVAAADEDFLLLAELISTTTTAESATPVYFTAPTPGEENGSGVANPGPAIVSPSHTPTVPLDSEDIIVTARVVPTFFAVSNVVLRYRVMFGAEVEVQMHDDGLHGDGATNDGIFGASIPANISTNGQMVRWFFRATDVQGNASRWPLFANPTASAEYLGTIVNPTNVTSKLPIIHLFAAPGVLGPGPTTTQTGADSQGGAYVSVFYDGEFYDNVKMELRGNSTAGFNKKSHRLDFNRDHRFRHLPGYPRIRKTSFTADYPDPTYMRQELSFWLCDQMGAPAPFYYPVRLQLNGQFYQLANHNDVHTDEYLERIGYDPNGALYNAAGQVVEPPASTGGFDKKTRTWDNLPNSNRGQDYVTMANAIANTVPVDRRRTNVFELFDVPEALNYLVVARWVHENDDVWANLSLYYDNDGDRLWRIMPFDMNLSWGAIFAEGSADLYTGVQATNDNHKAHPLYGSSQALALSGPGGAYNRVYDTFFQVPQLREMFLRRMRTLLDTHIKPPGTPTNSTLLEQRILANRDLIAEEALRDRAWWNWPGVGGQNNFAPGIDITNGVNQMLHQFLYARRQHFYGKHSVTNTALAIGIGKANNAGIPLAQDPDIVLHIGRIESNPSSGNQGHEFIQVTNPHPVAVDISGWRLNGGADFTFRPGTVIPSGSSIYVAADRNAFKTRTTSPRTNEAHFIVGNYQGTLDARGEIVELIDNTGRLVHTNGYVPSPSLAQQYLRITEIMYHPGPTNAGSGYPQEEFEYIELKNIGPVTLNLIGIHFTNGVTFTFTGSSLVTALDPGQTAVLVKNPAAYVSRYGAGATIAGIYSGSLDNGGERIKLSDAVGEQILDFTYNNTWYPITDGLGFSLTIIDENAAWDTWDDKDAWRASGVAGGSPGQPDPGVATFEAVLVNEVLANSEPPAVDAIELWNSSTNTADISGWWISDDFFTPKKFRVPNDTTIPAGGFIVFNETQYNPFGTNFSFSAQGDEAFLFSADAAGELTGYYHGFDYGASEPDVTFGRYVSSEGREHFVAQAASTLNAANSLPKVGPIVISEIMYHPPDIQTATNALDDSLNEFVELHNISGAEVLLYDPLVPTNRWRLTDAVTFSFPTTSIPAGGFLVAVSFDPATNAAALAAFRARYGIDANVAIVGPWTGELNNANESVKLRKPDRSDTDIVTHVLVDEVDYRDELPWDGVADGFGPSLQRVVAADFGNDPTNFVAAAPNPGSAFVGGAAPVITQQPADATVFAAGSGAASSQFVVGTTNFTVAVAGENMVYQWRFNGTPIPGATNFTLVLTNIQASDAGAYSIFAYNTAGAVFSSNAVLTVITPVTIVAQPVAQQVQPGSQVTLTVGAVGNGTLYYQWRFEGADIPGATNSSYSFTNANLAEHHGNFSVEVTDDVSSIVSSNALIYVRVNPGIVQHLTSQTVLQGGSVTFTVIATGAPPLGYRWVRDFGQLPALFTSEPTLTITNVQKSGNIRVVVTNLASFGGVQSPQGAPAQITMLSDFDQDGVADVWEAAYFGAGSSNNVNNATEDPDGDGMDNRSEYIAGTVPTNALSLLNIIFSATNANVITFVAQTNKSYSVQIGTNLSSVPAWMNLSNVTSSPQVRTIQVNTATAPGEGERYFRIVTPLVP